MEIICQCIADAYVAQSGRGYNTSELKAEENGDDKYILLGFQLPADIDPTTIEKMELVMYVKDYGGDYDWQGSDYYQDTMFFNALPPFNESAVNWSWHFNNSIYLGQDVLKTPIQKNAYYTILNIGMEYPDLLQPLLSYLTADKKLYFSWKGSDTWQTHSSRTGGHPPRLIITVPDPLPPNFDFVEEECFIKYGDELFCFADETKDIPPGTDIWVYFGAKNTGETASRLTVKVFDGDTKLCEKSPPGVVQPGDSIRFFTFCFKMTEANRDLVMKVYEYGKTEELDSLGCR